MGAPADANSNKESCPLRFVAITLGAEGHLVSHVTILRSVASNDRLESLLHYTRARFYFLSRWTGFRMVGLAKSAKKCGLDRQCH